MYSELLAVIRVTTARISIGTEHDLLNVVSMVLPTLLSPAPLRSTHCCQSSNSSCAHPDSV